MPTSPALFLVPVHKLEEKKNASKSILVTIWRPRWDSAGSRPVECGGGIRHSQCWVSSPIVLVGSAFPGEVLKLGAASVMGGSIDKVKRGLPLAEVLGNGKKIDSPLGLSEA